MLRNIGKKIGEQFRFQGMSENTLKKTCPSFVKALHSSSGFNRQRHSVQKPFSIYVPKDSFNLEEAKAKIERNGIIPEGNATLNVRANLPLEKEDKQLKALEIRYIRAENAIHFYGCIVSAGLAILRGTPYQPMQNEGIKASVRAQIDLIRNSILEEREGVQKELDARIACRQEYEKYKRLYEDIDI